MLQDLHERGFDVPVEDFNSYLREFMTKINELTPLSNVGYKRDDSGDEDNQWNKIFEYQKNRIRHRDKKNVGRIQ